MLKLYIAHELIFLFFNDFRNGAKIWNVMATIKNFMRIHRLNIKQNTATASAKFEGCGESGAYIIIYDFYDIYIIITVNLNANNRR